MVGVVAEQLDNHKLPAAQRRALLERLIESIGVFDAEIVHGVEIDVGGNKLMLGTKVRRDQRDQREKSGG